MDHGPWYHSVQVQDGVEFPFCRPWDGSVHVQDGVEVGKHSLTAKLYFTYMFVYNLIRSGVASVAVSVKSGVSKLGRAGGVSSVIHQRCDSGPKSYALLSEKMVCVYEGMNEHP